MSILRTFFLESSFHGFHFMIERDRHWTEKVFWLICVVLAWVASGYLIAASWYDFRHNAISFIVETNYLDWNTEFPSIAVCEREESSKVNILANDLFGPNRDFTVDEIIKEVAFYRGTALHTSEHCGPNAPPQKDCSKVNFTLYTTMVRKSCKENVVNCKWNNVPFDCCEYFTDLETELGVCYALNSAQTKNPSKILPMVSNSSSGPGTLFIELLGFQDVYILGKDDVPSLTTLQQDVLQISPHIHYKRFVAINDIDNDEEVRDMSIEQRNCRFMDENNLQIYRYYSYSACSVQCRKDAQIKVCNCTHHFMPNTTVEHQCEIAGLACLHNNYNELSALKAPWSTRSGLVCDCLPSCTEREIFLIRDERNGYREAYFRSIIEIILKHLPSEKFKRNVVRGKLDLVVSMGGTAALFIGASLLSFVEILYYFGPRFLWDIWLKRSTTTRRKPKVVNTNDLPLVI